MRVVFVHPGARYTFYRDVLEREVLPVDVPYLEIQDRVGVPEANEISPMLERARDMRRWAKRTKKEAHKRRPSMDLNYYRTGLNQEPAAQGVRTKLRNSAQKILWAVPKDSLVVVPSPRLAGDALLAEFERRKAPRQIVRGRNHYEGMEFLARPLRNLKKVPMLSLPSSVLASARSTRFIEDISGDAEDQLLRLYYGDYQRNSDFVAGVVAQTENFDALVLGQMIDLHVAIEHFLRSGKVLRPGQALYRSGETRAPQVHATINSPDGRASLESTGIATFAVKLLMIVAVSGVALGTAGKLIAENQILVENSAQQNVDPDILQASANALVDFFSTSGHENYTEYLKGLQKGLELNATKPTGKADIQP